MRPAVLLWLPEPPPKSFGEPVKTVIQRSQVPAFLDMHATDLESTTFQVDESVRRLKILKKFDRLVIVPQALERDWLWLSVEYGAGNQTIALGDVIKARQAKQCYVATEQGWVDCNGPQFDILDLLEKDQSDPEPAEDGQAVRLHRFDVLRLKAADGQQLHIEGDSRQVAELQSFLELKSAAPLPDLKAHLPGARRRVALVLV